MRVFFISDLHYGVSLKGDAAVRLQADGISDVGRKDDVLIIGGDIAVDDAMIGGCLKLFRRFRGTRFAIPGNHDIWVDPGDDSADRFNRLTTVFEKHGFIRLDNRPYLIGRTAFVGNMGWYDYSFRDDIGVDEEAYRLKSYPGRISISWADKQYVRWQYDDQEVTERLVVRLREDLEVAAGLADRIIVAMHHLPVKRLLVHPRWLVPKHWRFANAFLGSERFGAEILRHKDKVESVFCGHVHHHARAVVEGVEFVSNGGDYNEKSLLLQEDGAYERFLTITA